MGQRIEELSAKAIELKSVMAEVNESLKVAGDVEGPDINHWDAFDDMVDMASNALMTYAATAGLSEETTEALARTILKLEAVEKGAITVMKVGKALRKDSNLIMSVSALQAKAAAIATKMNTTAVAGNTVATKAATVAQKAFNVVAKANPYILLASAILAVGTAMFAFIKKSKEAEETEKAHKKALEDAAAAAQDWRDKVSNAVQGPLSKYKLLQAQYKSLKSEHQRVEWIKNNASAFEELGLSVTNTNAAENAFVNNTGSVVQALIKRATAMAKQEQLAALAAKYMDEKLKGEEEYAKRKVKAGDKVPGTSHTVAGGNEYVDRNGFWVYSEKGAQLANAKLKKQTEASANKVMADMEALAASLAKDIAVSPTKTTTTSGSTSSSSSSTPDIYGANSLRAAQLAASELQDKLNRMDTDSPEFEPTKKALEEAQVKVTKIQKMMEQAKPADPKTIVQIYEEASRKVQEIVKESQLQLNPDLESVRASIDAINEELKRYGLKPIEVELVPKEDKPIEGTVELEIDQNTWKDSVDKHFFEPLNSMANSVGAINSVYDAFSNLSERMNEAENGWEVFMIAFETGMTIMSAIASIMETINMLTTIGTALTQQDTAAKLANATAAGTKAGADAASAASAGTAAAAETAKATAGAASAVSWIPIVGPILAVAAIAAIIAAIMSARAKGKYATGGIVPGSGIGDMDFARVNGGEMILNGRQQSNLFRMIDQNRLPNSGLNGGNVVFTLQGDKLVGVIDNYNKKRNRI